MPADASIHDRGTQEDEIRQKVLNWAYNRYYNAKGVSGQVFTITEAKRELKEQGLSASEVSRAAQFLGETGYLTEERRPFRTSQGLLVPGTTYYRISHLGIAQIEGESRFKQPEWLAGLNLTNLGNITIMRDGNIVNTRFAGIYPPLDSLEAVFKDTDDLSDPEKRDALADIRTIKGQLGKSDPDGEITSRSWRRVKSFAQKVGAAAPYVSLAETLLRAVVNK